MKKAHLNKENLIKNDKFDTALYQKLFELPEKVLQFGTGVLLRGLPDYYIDKANKAGVFNGRIAVVKSTSQGAIDTFKDQDFLYTHFLAGSQFHAETIINASISRVLQADLDWQKILTIAINPQTELIISNTTEQGLVYLEESISSGVPKSFPMKLLALLHARFLKLGNTAKSEIIIIPTELIEYNGDLLKSLVLKGANFNKLNADFIIWLNNRVFFCNSLVDRIVPGKPKKEFQASFIINQPFVDDNAIISEPFGLWAIEGNAKIKAKLSFESVDDGVKVVDNIDMFKELKLRLLNGTHILACGTAVLQHIKTVGEGLENPDFRAFVLDILTDIKKSFLVDIDKQTIDDFANEVIKRFENPYIEHFWQSILLNYSEKMKGRIVPLLINYHKKYNKHAKPMIKGFASYLKITIPALSENDKYFALVDNKKIMLSDAFSESLFESYKNYGFENTVKNHLANSSFWGVDLNAIPDFTTEILAEIEKGINHKKSIEA